MEVERKRREERERTGETPGQKALRADEDELSAGKLAGEEDDRDLDGDTKMKEGEGGKHQGQEGTEEAPRKPQKVRPKSEERGREEEEGGRQAEQERPEAGRGVSSKEGQEGEGGGEPACMGVRRRG